MNIIQCQFCKKPFASIGGRICPACMEQIDKDYITVRDYIYENKYTHIDKVAKDTEVSKQHIMYLIKEGRLIMDSPDGKSGGALACEVCKKPISSGRMCKDCMAKIALTMDRSISSNKQPESKSAPERNLKGSAKIGGG